MPHKLSSCMACCMRRRTTIQCVRKSSITTSPYVKVRRPELNLLKAGNWALESVGFMTQRALHRPLPTGHHSNDLVPLHSGTLDSSRRRCCITQHRHLICRAITAGSGVEHCANCSPSHHARHDSLCQCRPWHLARHVGDNIPG